MPLSAGLPLLLTPAGVRGLTYLGFGILVAAALWALAYRLLRIPTSDAAEMTYLEHAEEARRRILRGAFALAFWTTFFITFRLQPFPVGRYELAYPHPDIYGNAAAQAFRWVAQTTVPDGVTLIVARSTEAVAAQLAVAFFLALLVSLPMLFYEVWGFFAPAMTATERRVTLAALPVSVLLFLTGAAFAFAYVVPLLLDVLYRFADPLDAVQFLNAGNLVSTVAAMLTIFGLAFQLPLAMTGLSALGIVRPETFRAKWRHAIVIALIAGALITDPSIVTQTIVASCLIALYFLGLAAAYLFRKEPV